MKQTVYSLDCVAYNIKFASYFIIYFKYYVLARIEFNISIVNFTRDMDTLLEIWTL